MTPAGTAGARDVRVTLSGGQAATLTGGFTYTSGTSTDSDGDGLTNDWETLYGLNPNSAAGDDGATGDPDADGRDQHRRADGRLASARHAQAVPGRGRQQRLLRHPLRHRQPADERGARPADVRRHDRPHDAALRRRCRRGRAPPSTRAPIAALSGASFATTMEADAVVVLDRLMTWSARRLRRAPGDRRRAARRRRGTSPKARRTATSTCST